MPTEPKVFAVAQSVPVECDYLTAGKRYEVLEEVGDRLFRYRDDAGSLTTGRWSGDMHLDGGNWTRIEGEEPAAEACEVCGGFISPCGACGKPPIPALEDAKIVALRALLDRYVELASSGDAGFWDPEEEPVVINARAALEGEGE
jgi:hypothetical protein